MIDHRCISEDVKLGKDVRLAQFVNLYGCEVGDESKVGAFVEIQKNARVGARCKISSHTFVCEGVIIESEVFVGHGVTFINDRYPRATTPNGELQTDADWTCQTTVVKQGASIGSGATVLGSTSFSAKLTAGHPAKIMPKAKADLTDHLRTNTAAAPEILVTIHIGFR